MVISEIDGCEHAIECYLRAISTAVQFLCSEKISKKLEFFFQMTFGDLKQTIDNNLRKL